MNKKFNKRAFISLVTFFLSITVLITGVVLLIMPDATMAYWNKWSFIALEKNEWESFHAVISIYLTIIVVFHIIQNWKPMLSYMKSKTNENFKHKKELFLASVVSVVLIIGSFTSSPISMVTDIFEPVQKVWYTTEYEPPFEDAQGLPLHMLAEVEKIELKKIEEVFGKNNIKYGSLDDTLEDIADTNSISSRELYLMIK